MTNSILKCLHRYIILVFYQVPFINKYNKAFPVLLYQREDIHVLAFYPSCGVNHEDTYIRILNHSDGSNYRKVFQILTYFTFFSYSCSINKIKVHSKPVVSVIYGVSGSTCNICHDTPFLI